MNFSFKDFKSHFQKDNQNLCKNINVKSLSQQKIMQSEDIKSPSTDEQRESSSKNDTQKLNLQYFKSLQNEIKRGNNSNVYKGKLNQVTESSLENTKELEYYNKNDENIFPIERPTSNKDQSDKNKQKPISSIVIMENYIADNKSLLKDTTQMRNNLKLSGEIQKTMEFNSQQASEKYTSEGSSVCESNQQLSSRTKNARINIKEFSCTDLLEQTQTYKLPLTNDQMSNGIVSSTIDENDMIQVDTLREYYMENEDQLEQLRRQQTADFQFGNPDEIEGEDLLKNPYLDDDTLLAIEKVGTLSPTKIMNEIRQINKELNSNSERVQNFYENDLKTQVYMLKLQMKARMEDGLIQQRLELKTILNQYLQFIDKLMKDKANLSETLQFSQTENLQLRDQLHEIMSKYDETENQLKQIFIAYKDQSEQNKREVELKEKKISQITEQLVFQEQGVKNIKQKYEGEYQDLLNQNKEILKQIMQLNSENDKLQNENTQLQEKISTIQNELTTSKSNSQALAQKNTQLEEADKQSSKLITFFQENLIKFDSQVENSLKQQDCLQQEQNENNLFISNKFLNSFQEGYQQMIRLVQNISEKLEKSHQNTKMILSENKILMQVNKELEVKLNENEERYQHQSEQQNKQYSNIVSNLQIELNNNKQIINNLQESYEIQTKQSNIVQQLNTQHQQEISLLKQQVQEMKAEQEVGKSNLQEKEQLINQLENSIIKFKDQIHKNLLMIDEIFSGFKEKESLYHQEIMEKVQEIKYLKEIVIKYEDEVQKFYTQNEQIQMQQIDLLRSYFINHEQAKSSKNFIEHIQNQVTQKFTDVLIYDQANNKRSGTPSMIETFVGQRESRNCTPVRQQQSQNDSLQSTQLLGGQENYLMNGSQCQANKKLSQSSDNNLESIRKLKINERSESPFSIQEIESQRLYKIEQKNLIQSLEFEKTMKNALLQKDESINQLTQVINSLKILSESQK